MPASHEDVFVIDDLSVRYSGRDALRNVSMVIPAGGITALIGPSGCGKSTLLRCLNRMNDLIRGCAVEGSLFYHGEDLYASDVDPVEVRRRIGMVFQRPNPFKDTIYSNVSFGPRLNGMKKGPELDEVVEKSLRRAVLWDEVKDQLTKNAFALSGGQQQRLCIARALATDPDVVLMDEPCSALDPIATMRIEDLMRELSTRYTIIVVTHNMQQAARVSDRTAFFSVSGGADDGGDPAGELVEFDETVTIFSNANDSRTEAYVTGRFG